MAGPSRRTRRSTQDWPSYGLDYAETRFSRLRRSTPATSKDLGLVWSYDLESTRGVEATPLVVDGIMYVTASWSIVHAIDVRTGKRLWTYDPKVDREGGYKGCCDVVNRGVALYKGKVFVGAYDGRLIALDAATGSVVWEKDTIIDRTRPYTITGAPRVFKGKVIIGNGGAEYGVRGYITAYDAETGAQKWRWFTVPGDPGKPFENDVDGEGREDLGPERQVLGSRRRRHGLGHDGLRSRSSTSCTSAPATARPGRATSAAPPAATTCTSPPSSRSIRTPASTSGTTRRRPATTGTSPRRSR